MADKDNTDTLRRIRRGFFAAMGFLAMGYIGFHGFSNPYPAVAIMGVAAGFLARRSTSVKRGVLYGTLLGLMAGLGIYMGWVSQQYHILNVKVATTQPDTQSASAPYAPPGRSASPKTQPSTRPPTSQEIEQSLAAIERQRQEDIAGFEARKTRVGVLVVGATVFLAAVISAIYTSVDLRRRQGR
ncbi:MAG: hypothetical protein ABFD92_17515 [Planctomycetaceae bacterium]|nr:hypothetical protein [Planctomycetaceae bacterium]